MPKQQNSLVVGLGGAWGFAPSDLTSSVQAADQGAFTVTYSLDENEVRFP